MPTIAKAKDKLRSGAQHLQPGAAKNVGKVVLSSVDSAIESRWNASKERAKRLKGDSIDDKIKALGKLYDI